METLDDLMGTPEEPTDLNIFNPSQEASAIPPMSAIKTRAAGTSLLAGDPNKAVENYQLMVAEGETGGDQITKSLQGQAAEQSRKLDMQSMMGVLSDASIPYERKKAVVDAFNKSAFLKEPSVQLMTNALAQGSRGETEDNERARLTVSDAIGEIHEVSKTVQGLVNAHTSSLDWKNAKTVADTAALWLAPFGTSVSVAKVTEEQRKAGESIWGTVKSFLLPGTKIKDLHEKLRALPPAEREAFTTSLLDSISKKSGVVFSSENQFAQMQMASQVFSDDGYSNTDKWIDNVSVLLDIVGLGAFVRGGKTAAKGAKAAEATQVPTTVKQTATGPVKPSATPSAQTTESIFTLRPRKDEEIQGSVATFQQNLITKLEAEKADLLGTAGNLAESGAIRALNDEIDTLRTQLISDSKDSVKNVAKEIQAAQGISYKEALKEANKRVTDNNASVNSSIGRIEQQVNINREAATATQRIASIEKEIGQLKSAMMDTPGALTPVADLVRRIEVRSVVTTYNPSSPAAIMQQANPEKSRALFEATFKSEGDAVAEGLYGTTKMDAVAGDVFPQAVTESGKVVSKPIDIQRNLRKSLDVPEDILQAVQSSGGLQYTRSEKAAARANKVNEFAAAEGLHMVESMGSHRTDGDQLLIGAVYGTPDGAFSNAEEAYNQALYALRGQGILPEEITILRKDGLDHSPVKLEDVKGIEGNYLIRVELRSEIDPTDISNWEMFDVKRNWVDRIPQLNRPDSGSAARLIMDAASMLHPVYTGAASVASDRGANFEKLMLNFASYFSDKFTSLRKGEQTRVNEYLREANTKELKLDTVDLMARGFSTEAIESVQAWRKYWDGHFYLENLDLVRTLNGQGFQRLISPNADLFGKPLGSYQDVGKIYDPTTDMVLTMSNDALKSIYDNGGYVARLRRPTAFGADTTEHVLVRNNSNEYMRTIRDSDQVLNYRDGYYQVQYKAPRFVDEIDANGMRRAVAVAGDTKEAEAFAQRMRGQNPDMVYHVRSDDRVMRTSSDDWFDINSASGRIAQRHRGKLLEDASGLNLLGDGSYVVNPVESAIAAARSIAGRTINRPMLEGAKARFMHQYERFLPSDGMGGRKFPNEAGDIGAKGEQFTSEVADARTTYEYIRYLENGYINGMDNVYKASMNALADMLGKKGMAKAERAAMLAGEVSISGAGKGSVFMALIGTNVLRQWVVQAHQGIRTIAYNPTGWATGAIEKNTGQYLGIKSTALSSMSKEAQDFTKFVDDSGLMAAVDKQNLVRGTLLSASDSSNKLVRAASAIPNALRRIGFDQGEAGNSLIHAAAVYDRYKRLGKDLTDKSVRDEAYSEIRALSYDMNFAGDMPYNQNSAAMLLQFMQVPHKAMLQATNRRLDRATRARLVVADTLMWGVPGAAAISAVMGGDILPEDAKMREAILYGLESMMMNHYIRELADSDDINIDFSSLAPHDMTGWGEFFHAMLTGGASQMIANSPAGQLFFKEGGRTREAIASVARFFGMQEDIDETPQEALAVINEVLKISSGWNNAVKAHLALETGKTYDKHGRLIDSKTHPVEAYMQAFGFPSANQRDLYQASQTAATKTKEHKEEVLSVYKGALRYYQTELERGNTDVKFITKVTSFALRKYKDDPVAQEIIYKQLSLDLQNKDTQLMSQIMKAINLPNATSMRDSIRQMPVPEEQKQLLMQRIDDIENIRKQKGN